MKWTRYSSEEMRRKEVDDAMSSWGDSYQVPPLKPPQKTCILWSNSIVVTWWPSSICHFGGTFSHQNFERSECFMDTPSPFASWNPSPLELSQQFFGIKLLQVSRIVSTVSNQTWHVLCGALWLWA